MHPIRRLTEARSGLLQLLGVAIAVATGVNLVSGELARILGAWAVWVGIAAIVATLFGIALAQLRGLKETVRLVGAIAVHKNKVLDIDRYSLAENTARVLEAVTRENEALSRQWENDPLVFPRDDSDREKDRRNTDGAGAALFREALEHVYLEHLSRHLNDFFSNSSLSHLVKEHVRSDLLPLLPDNRVLDLLSSPLEDRIALVEAEKEPGAHFMRMMRKTVHPDGREEDVLMWASDGEVMFQRLDLALPRGVTVKRISKGHIRLDSRVLRTDLRVEFDGYSTGFDPQFLRHYADVPPADFFGRGDDAGEVWQVDFEFTSAIKWMGMFTARGWRLHRWAESFAESARKSLDHDCFLQEIGWEHARTVLIAEENLRRRDRDKAKPAPKAATKPAAKAAAKPATKAASSPAASKTPPRPSRAAKPRP